MSVLEKPLDGAGLATVNQIINERLNKKQDALTAGDNIIIEQKNGETVISSTGGGSVNWDDINGRPDLSTVSSMSVKIITLLADSWVEKSQTIIVGGILADETKQLIVPLPASDNEDAYNAAEVKCTTQGENKLTFACADMPVSDLVVNVFVIESVLTDAVYNYEWWSPQMTSNTTPDPFIASGAAVFGAPYNAFDNNVNTFCAVNDNTGWLQFDFGTEIIVAAIEYSNRPDGFYKQTIKTGTIYGSKDGVIWDELAKFDETLPQPTAFETRTLSFDVVNSYRYYKFSDLAGYGDVYASPSNIRFFKEVRSR